MSIARKFFSRMTATAVAITMALGLILFTGSSIGQTNGTPQAQSSSTIQTDHGNLHLVAAGTDCIVAAGEIYGGMQAKGLRIAIGMDAFKKHAAKLVGVIPGTECGKWLGKYNVMQICWWTQRSVWLPPAAYSRGLVWVLTGGQTNQCTP